MLSASDLPLRFKEFHSSLVACGHFHPALPLSLPLVQKLYAFLHGLKGSIGLSTDPKVQTIAVGLERLVDVVRALSQNQLGLSEIQEMKLLGLFRDEANLEAFSQFFFSEKFLPLTKPTIPQQAHPSSPLDSFAQARLEFAVLRKMKIHSQAVQTTLSGLEKLLRSAEENALRSGGLLVSTAMKPIAGNAKDLALEVTLVTAA